MSSEFDKYLDKSQPWETDPLAKHWLAIVDEANSYQLSFEQKLDGLTWKAPRIFLTYVSKSGEPRQLKAKYDEVLNDGLIEFGCKCETLSDEQLRFGLMLTDAWRRASIKYGDGFFNAVLLRMLRTGPFGRLRLTRETLTKVGKENDPYRSGESYGECLAMLEGSLARLGGLLIEKLKYRRDDALQVLDGAIALFLERRYHLRERELLGW